jgi:multicomponent Na+:H+ antiporter subunit E
MLCLFCRTLVLLVTWSIISGITKGDLAIGVVTAAAAALVSVRLAPCASAYPNLAACVMIALRLPMKAMVAGADVARRALHPGLPLAPGFIPYKCSLSQGPGRNAYSALVSMLPGSVPIEINRDGDFLIHCLDAKLSVAEGLAREEAEFRTALSLENANSD